jgi:hypothetical protein
MESGCCQAIADLRRDIAAFVQIDLVLIAPHEPMGGNRNQKVAAWAKHPAYLAERGGIVVKVLDNIERRDQIKRAVGEGQGIGRAETNIEQAALVAVPHRFFIDVDTLRLSI